MRFELLIKQLVLLNDTDEKVFNTGLLQYKGGFRVDVRFINEQTIMIYFENNISEETYRNVTAMVRWIGKRNIRNSRHCPFVWSSSNIF